MIAILILAVSIVPLIELFTGGREQAHMSEHRIYAELLCSRAIEECATRPYGFLYRCAGNRGDFFRAGSDKGLLDQDKKDGMFSQFEEYEHNAWKGPAPITSDLTIEPVGDGPGAGIMAIMIKARWGDIRAVGLKDSNYSLLRLRTKRDYGLRTVYDPQNEL